MFSRVFLGLLGFRVLGFRKPAVLRWRAGKRRVYAHSRRQLRSSRPEVARYLNNYEVQKTRWDAMFSHVAKRWSSHGVGKPQVLPVTFA